MFYFDHFETNFLNLNLKGMSVSRSFIGPNACIKSPPLALKLIH
jgi:hypothetical protein